MGLFDSIETTVVEFIPPGCDQEVRLMAPPTAEYVRLVREGGEHEGKVPPPEYVARVITACLVDGDGNRIGKGKDGDAIRKELLDAPPKVTMAIYRHCWSTVLNAGPEAVAKREGN